MRFRTRSEPPPEARPSTFAGSLAQSALRAALTAAVILEQHG
jgi:hypothetical protein